MDNTGKTIEQKVAEKVLQKEETITVGEHTYTYASPSVATLVLASEIISRLPHLHLDQKRILEDSLAVAKDCKELGDLVAVLILGAKHVDDVEETYVMELKFHLMGLFHTKHKRVIRRKHREVLAKELMEDLTPRELLSLTGQLLHSMQVGDFFGLTTFLTEINLTTPTKVETGATASGQS